MAWRNLSVCVYAAESQRRLGLNRTNSSQRLKSQSWMGYVISLRSEVLRGVGDSACPKPAKLCCGTGRLCAMRQGLLRLCATRDCAEGMFVLMKFLWRDFFHSWARTGNAVRRFSLRHVSVDNFNRLVLCVVETFFMTIWFGVRRTKNFPCLFWIGNLPLGAAARNDDCCEISSRSISDDVGGVSRCRTYR